MKSFSYLNSIGAKQLYVFDQRLAKVTFNKNPPLFAEDRVLKITGISSLVKPTIDITEIINYEIAQCRYQVKIIPGSGNNLLTNSSITWDSLPSGVNLNPTNQGNIKVYTLSGITTKNIWDAVKNFNWLLPSNYNTFPLWYLEVSILYYDEATQKSTSRSWRVYDDRFYYFAQMISTFNQEIKETRTKLAICNLQSKFTLGFDDNPANLNSNFSAFCDGDAIVVPITINLKSKFSIVARPKLPPLTLLLDFRSDTLFSITITGTNVSISVPGIANPFNLGDVTSQNFQVDGFNGGGSWPSWAQIVINGYITNLSINSRISGIKDWGNNPLTNINNILVNVNKQNLPEYIPEGVTDLSYLFRGEFDYDVATGATLERPQVAFYPIADKIKWWNTSSVTNMAGMFAVGITPSLPYALDPGWHGLVGPPAGNYNPLYRGLPFDLSRWDTSNVTDMSQMFFYSYINPNISTWNTSKVTSMARMFEGSNYFNQPLNDWDTSNVTIMAGMFQYCFQFNQALNKWKTGKVSQASYYLNSSPPYSTDYWNGMKRMFYYAYAMQGRNLSMWDVNLIPTTPDGFDTLANVIPPNWGTYGN